MKWIQQTLSLVVAGVALAACGDDPTGPLCTTEAVFGINLSVRDGAGAPAAAGALGIAIEGSFADTLMIFGPTDMGGALERAGTYDISVSKPGHTTWSANGIVVLADECHVIPVNMDATLIAVP